MLVVVCCMDFVCLCTGAPTEGNVQYQAGDTQSNTMPKSRTSVHDNKPSEASNAKSLLDPVFYDIQVAGTLTARSRASSSGYNVAGTADKAWVCVTTVIGRNQAGNCDSPVEPHQVTNTLVTQRPLELEHGAT